MAFCWAYCVHNPRSTIHRKTPHPTADSEFTLSHRSVARY